MHSELNLSLSNRKVVLQPFELADINEKYINWLNDPEVVKYSNQRFLEHGYHSCRAYYDSFDNSENLFIKILCADDMAFIGTLTVYFSPNHQTADIGIMIGEKSYWGRGLGAAAWRLILDWIKSNTNTRKVTAGTMSVNVGMLNIFERSGMVYEATRKRQELLDGKPVDLVYYAYFND